MANTSTSSEITSQVAKILGQARHAVLFTGAGVSTPSGIPDFRGKINGQWKKHDPMRVASATSFYQTPAIFYDWFRPLFLTSWKAQPNQAHIAMAKLVNTGLLKSIITQNIDGLHQKAGARKVLELHGSARFYMCPACKLEVKADEVFVLFEQGTEIPRCQKCHSVIKPDVVLFEEPLPENTWQEAESEARLADVLLVAGSSLEVFPASMIPQNALSHGCKLLINNLSPTPLDAYASCLIRQDTASFFPELLAQLNL